MSLDYYIREEKGGFSINLLVDGMHCPSCVALIEDALLKNPAVRQARLNLSTRRLNVVWQGEKNLADDFITAITKMGYRAAPYDPETEETMARREEKFLLRCLAVAGFASGNLMLFSVPLWSSSGTEMGMATRELFHWIQAIIAIPAIAYCGLPFYRSALNALKLRRTNMDVPISVAVVLATIMSLFETITKGQYAYFDSGVMLLFFLLIGRYLEARAKGKARSAAHDLLQMMKGDATIIDANGQAKTLPISQIRQGMILLVSAGEKIAADGVIIDGDSDIDASLITGESIPQATSTGTKVFAGSINISAPLKVSVSRVGEDSLLAQIVKLMETAEQSQSRYVTLADRISSWYTPAVHALAAATFIGWLLIMNAPWQQALLYAATVLIITCPCALGLAVPVVQVLASGKLMRSGILLKSGSAIERLAEITHAVFDKTGTLTLGRPELLNRDNYRQQDLQLAASLAVRSKHPLSRAIAAAYSGELLDLEVKEIQGSGLEAVFESGIAKLGKRSWCGIKEAGIGTASRFPPPPAGGEKRLAFQGGHLPTGSSNTFPPLNPPMLAVGETSKVHPGQQTCGVTENSDSALELWLCAEGESPVRFTFSDTMRVDAADVVSRFREAGVHISMLSGDREASASSVAKELGITDVKSEITPIEKTTAIHDMQKAGGRVLMVGDGLNDAPSLASAHVSMSPSTAMDITQNAADIVFQGDKLMPVITAWRTAIFAQVLVRQNFLLAILYNVVAIPLAVAGMVTPLVAAIAMSSSSLIVIANAMRLELRRKIS